MRGYGWKIGRLAWMRRQDLGWDGEVNGYRRVVSRLFWFVGYPDYSAAVAQPETET